MKIITVLIFFTASIFAQDESIINLFPGKWKVNFDKAEYYEEWEVVSDSELIGKSYELKNGVQLISENLCIKKFAGQWAYVSLPKDQTITLFALVTYWENRFVFENKEHDFPQRIIYEFLSNGKLIAAIEGDIEGKIKRKEYSFNRVDE